GLPEGHHAGGLQRGRSAGAQLPDLPVLGVGVSIDAGAGRERERGGDPAHQARERGVGTRHRRQRAARTELRSSDLAGVKVRSLTLEEVLRVWERGEGQSAATRALTLLAFARPEASSSALTAATIGEREAAVLGLRIRLWGRGRVLLAPCPACGITIEFAVDAATVLPDDAAAALPALTGTEPKVLELDGWRVVFRLPTVGDLLAVEQAGGLPVPA